MKVRKRTKIRNRYNQAHAYPGYKKIGNVITSQIDITNESQEVSPFHVTDVHENITQTRQKY